MAFSPAMMSTESESGTKKHHPFGGFEKHSTAHQEESSWQTNSDWIKTVSRNTFVR